MHDLRELVSPVNMPIWALLTRFGSRAALAVQPALEYMTMPSLLTWRMSCHDAYLSVNQHLRSTLHCLLSRFVPNPAYFLQIIAPWGCLIVGEAALSHVLHDPSVCGASMELAIGNLYFQPFIDCLLRLLPYGTLLHSLKVAPAPPGFPFHRHITRYAEFRLTSGLFVVLYESSTPSACDIVSGYWTTALMNFVTGYTFGCAYPRLTFNHFYLVCDSRMASMVWWDHDLALQLDHLNFLSDTRPLVSPVSSRGPSSDQPALDMCGKTTYVCPLQGRFFGDRGSLVLFYDGFCVDLDGLRELGVAPYGPMVMWRLPSTGTCDGDCLKKDKVMPPFIVSMLSLFAEENSGFTRAHAIFHTISDPNSRDPVVLPPANTRARRYSL